MQIRICKFKREYKSNNVFLFYSSFVDYADDRALLANTPGQAKSLLHNQGQTAGGFGLHVNANKTEYICFKQGAFSTLSSRPLKLVHNVTYLSSNISSTESDVNICVA